MIDLIEFRFEKTRDIQIKSIFRYFLAMAGSWFLLPFALQCVAATVSEAPRLAHPRWTLYAGRLADNDLPVFASDTLRGRLSWRHSYFLGAGYLQPVKPPDWLHRAAGRIGLEHISHHIEWIGLQHFGGQHNSEMALAYMVHSPHADWGGLRLRAGGGVGPSLALGRPSAEDGPDAQPEKRSRLQHYIALEVEAAMPELSAYSVVLRLHHRSGVYGLVAPKGVGSNFVTLGLRLPF